MKSKLIEHMTWQQVEQAMPHTKAVIIPLGAQSKEHGYHLPMNTDYNMANYLRDRLLEQVDNLLAMPTIGYNYFPAFIEYPGSVNLDVETSKGIVLGICRCLAGQGFQKFYILNTGFSTNKILEQAQAELQEENIVMAYLKSSEVYDRKEIKAITQQQRGSHADELETSMMLYITPDKVQMDKAQKDDNEDRSGPLTRDPCHPDGLYAPTGAWGDPTLATVDKGEVITNVMVEWIVREVQAFI
jgi:creatinine amidohydrolase